MKSLAIAIVPLCASVLLAQDRPQQTQTEIKTTQTTVTVGPADQAADESFDVRHGDDRGKLLVHSKGVTFENISDAKKSKTWTYAQIKKLERDGDEIEIEPFDGGEVELKIEGGKRMSDSVYKVISDRIVAARNGR